jgi:tRNA pseudouridine55 synthase
VTERRAPALDLDGLLVVDKPRGWTSHDVVARVRRLLGVRRVGHAGTLDPSATGVLPLGVGRGTRLLEFAADADKSYEATVRLGASTDTYDADGTVVATGDWTRVTVEMVTAALHGFVGTIEQRPPAFSAIKQGGVAVHRLARAGKTVDLPMRTVTVERIDVRAIALPDVMIVVRCSKGTYIRSLAHDLGQRLGCGAHLAELRRTETAGFTLADAHPLDHIEGAVTSGALPALLLPPDAPLLGRPALVLSGATALALRCGVAPPAGPTTPDRGVVRAYDEDGYLIALVRGNDAGEAWDVVKVLDPSP